MCRERVLASFLLFSREVLVDKKERGEVGCTYLHELDRSHQRCRYKSRYYTVHNKHAEHFTKFKISNSFSGETMHTQ